MFGCCGLGQEFGISDLFLAVSLFPAPQLPSKCFFLFFQCGSFSDGLCFAETSGLLRRLLLPSSLALCEL